MLLSSEMFMVWGFLKYNKITPKLDISIIPNDRSTFIYFKQKGKNKLSSHEKYCCSNGFDIIDVQLFYFVL